MVARQRDEFTAWARAAAAAMLVVVPALGATARAEGWGGALGLSSDKLFRGLSQSEGHASALADLYYRSDTGWSAGAGLATLYHDPGEGNTAREDMELTLRLGHGWQLDPDWSAQLDCRHYAYTGGPRQHAYDYDECGASLGWRGRASLSLSLSPDTTGRTPYGAWRTGRAAAIELTLHQPVAGRLGLDAGIGYDDLHAVLGAGYPYGGASLVYGAGRFNLYLGWVTSRAAERGLASAKVAGDRWAATVLWGF